MSVQYTVYMNDSKINAVRIQAQNGLWDHTTYYPNNDTTSGFTSGSSMKFTATAASGCRFYRWVYRLGNSDPYYSYDNPLTLYPTADVQIRAEGEDDTSTWNKSTDQLDVVSAETTISKSFDAGRVWCFAMKFNTSGTAIFQTTGSCDTYGYLTATTCDINGDTGAPTGTILAQNDDGGEGYNCKIQYTVNANQWYYFFVRLYSSTSTGTPSIKITPPGASTYTVTYYHYIEDVLQTTTQDLNVAAGAQITLANKATSISGHAYNHATDSNGNTVTTATINSNATFNLYYTPTGSNKTLTVYRNGNCKRVDIVYNGSIIATSDESSTPAQASIPSGATVVLKYTPYTNHSAWYKFHGWWTGGSASGTCYGKDYNQAITMPAANLKLYGYAVRISGNFAWTYAKVQYGDWNLTAQEWNELWDAICTRKGANLSQTLAISGDDFTATIYNEAATALQLSTVSRGDTITAALMNGLVTKVNSI